MNLPPLLQMLLWPLSLIYGVAVWLRDRMYRHEWLKQKSLRGTVISVGNITVGGTGKTPMVIWLAERFLADGKRVAILSRGYRGAAGTSDEIELMKYRLQNRVGFGVGGDRFAKGKELEQSGYEVFLLDDGFQHRQLARDLDIVLVDASRSIGGQFLLPAGPLREHLSALSRADLVVFTRTENAPGARQAIEKLWKFPVFAASTKLIGFRLLAGDTRVLDVSYIGPGPFFAFCGIGNSAAFFHDLENWGLSLAGTSEFRDHHRYTVADIEKMERSAREQGAKALVTTEKDAYNLAGLQFKNFVVFVAVIEMDLTPEDEFVAAIRNKLRSAKGAVA